MNKVSPPSPKVEKMEWSTPLIKKMPASETYYNLGTGQDAEGFTSTASDAAGV